MDNNNSNLNNLSKFDDLNIPQQLPKDFRLEGKDKSQGTYLGNIGMTRKTLSTTRTNDGTPTKGNKYQALLFGCKNCPYRGMERCLDIQKSAYEGALPSYMRPIGKNEVHENGICKGRLNEVLEYFDLMGKPSGMRIIRNRNIMRVQEYTDMLYSRLLEVKESGAGLTEEEKGLLYAFHQMTMELNRRLESALKQDEGIKVDVVKLTPSQINDLIADAREKKQALMEKATVLEITALEDSNGMSASTENEEVKEE